MEEVKTKSLISSDYIMSSLDISKALGWDHDKILDVIHDFVSMGVFENRGYFRPVMVTIGRKYTTMFLFDLEAVIEISETLAEDEDLVDAANAILKMYFDLASKRSIVSSKIYDDEASKLSSECIEHQRFMRRLRSCVDANMHSDTASESTHV